MLVWRRKKSLFSTLELIYYHVYISACFYLISGNGNTCLALIVILEVDTLFICSLLDQTAANIHAMQYKWHFLTHICEGYPRSKPLSHYAT